jgi:DNA-binding NarL/FixJ family response regulator
VAEVVEVTDGSVQVLVADDTDDIRQLVCLLLEVTDGAEVVAEASDAAEALAAWEAHRPDVLILDNHLPDGIGLDVAEQILTSDPTAAIVLFSAYLDGPALARAGRLGVRACVSKEQVRRLPELVLLHGRS